jgi:hypothetical protein
MRSWLTEIAVPGDGRTPAAGIADFGDTPRTGSSTAYARKKPPAHWLLREFQLTLEQELKVRLERLEQLLEQKTK